MLLAVPVRADMSVSGKALQSPGIKGDDNREMVDVSKYPWRSIGRLNRNGSHCTAVLIGPDIILTAAHCFWDPRRRQWSVSSAYHFILGYQRGAYAAHSRIESFTLGGGQITSASPETPLVEEDWAIARLVTPLGKEYGFLGFSELQEADVGAKIDAGLTVIQAGYSRDIAHVLTADQNCRIESSRRTSESTMLLHQCDATEGDSGSPLLVREGDAYRILGLHVATIFQQDGASEGVALFAGSFRKELAALLAKQTP